MSDYFGLLANCALQGIEFTTGTKDGKAWSSRNLIRINAGGFALELYQNTDLPANLSELSGRCVETTKLVVRNVDERDLPHLQKVIEHVSELLSFATESRVLPFGYEYPAGSGLGGRIAMVGTVQRWRPPFGEPEHAKAMVEMCYDNYVNLRNRRMLHVAIDYIHHSIMKGLAEEVKIGLACIAFENLRHNWALDCGYPHLDGYFREKLATATNPGATIGIKRHLTEMFNDVGMNCDSKRIVDTRNELLHTGLYGNLNNDDIHEFLETALREYFLRVIGYSGPFRPYIGGSPAPDIM
jgi:hypothetical protein